MSAEMEDGGSFLITVSYYGTNKPPKCTIILIGAIYNMNIMTSFHDTST
jgi:hypothetical protein